MEKDKKQKRLARHRRLRAKIKGSSARPRLSVFRSSKYLFVQIIDDSAEKTLLGLSSKVFSAKNRQMTKLKAANLLGEYLAKKAIEKRIKRVVFDRGGYKYDGRVKAFAEAARKAGLEF